MNETLARNMLEAIVADALCYIELGSVASINFDRYREYIDRAVDIPAELRPYAYLIDELVSEAVEQDMNQFTSKENIFDEDGYNNSEYETFYIKKRS